MSRLDEIKERLRLYQASQIGTSLDDTIMCSFDMNDNAPSDIQYLLTRIERYEKALAVMREALEFYAAALNAKHDGVIPEAIINGGEFIPLGTNAKLALAESAKCLDESGGE